MITDLLNRIRPRDRSARSAADSLAAAEAALAAAQARVADMESKRAAALLDLPPAEAAQFESDLAAARAETERLALLRGELEARRDAAEKAERETAAEAAFAEAERLAREAAATISAAVPAAVDGLAQALEAERDALAAIDEATRVARLAGIDRAPPAAPMARLVGQPARLRDLISVPDVEAPWGRSFGSFDVRWALHPRQ